MLNINNKNLIYFIFGLFAGISLFILMPQNTNAEICTLTNPEEYKGYCNDMNNNSNYGNGNGYNNNYYNNGNYNYSNRINPTPFISSVNPSSVNINSSKIITIKGNNFVQGSIVKLDNFTIPTTFIDSGTLQSTLRLDNLGEHFVTVFNPAPGGGYSNEISIMAKNVSSTGTINNTSSKNNSTYNKTKSTTSTLNTENNTANNERNSNTEQDIKGLAAGAIFGYNAFMPSSLLQWIFFAILILLAVILWRKLYVSDEEKHKPLKHA